MTRQHFRLIAAAFAEAREAAEAQIDPATRAGFLGGVEAAQKRVAAVCKQFNPGFNAERFEEACNPS